MKIFTKAFLMRSIIFLAACHFQKVSGQSRIHGFVVDNNNKPVPMANVFLLQANDSSLRKGVVTTLSGTYSFHNIPEGNYIISGTYVGFQKTYTAAFVIGINDNDKDAGTIQLSPEDKKLDDVTVIAKKPLLEQTTDRLIINVENSITSAGSTALEILERSPGIVVDLQNGIISLNGKNNVVVMINGKVSHMPISAAIQMLAGMSSGNIEKIELITTPPANLDAEGDAGYINIVLKENNNYGTNGSYSATLGYGKGWVAEASINFNHRKGRVNMYGDFSYSRIKKPLPIISYNKISDMGDIRETFVNNNRVDTQRNVMGRLGLDYDISKHTVMGILISGYDNRYTQAELSTNLIKKNGELDTTIRLANSEINHWNNFSGNLNMQHNFGDEEKLFVNMDYFYYYNNQPANYFSSYFDNTGDFVYKQNARGGKRTNIHFWVGAIDYVKQLCKKISVEAGVKETTSAFTNDVTLEKWEQNAWAIEKSLSANYILNENYSAAYISFKVTANKNTEAKLGLRYEYTNSNLGTTEIKNMVDNHYGDFFPSLSVSHKLNENHSVNISYSSRITRPTINNLAPFTYFINANTELTGNPALQPAISNTLMATYTFKKYLFSLSFSKSDNYIAFQPHSDSVTNKIVISPQNLINLKTIFTSLAVPVKINTWWSMQYNLSGVWQQVNALYDRAPVRLEQINYNLNMSQSFKLPDNYSIELTGFYQSPLLVGIAVRQAYGTLVLGIKKKMNDNKGSFFFVVNDIFNTVIFAPSVNLPEQNLITRTHIAFSQRTFKLTYSRTFGKDKLKGKRNRLTGAEDEKERVQ